MGKDRIGLWSKSLNSSVKNGGCSVLAWACMAGCEKGSFIYIDDVTRSDASIINSELNRKMLSTNYRGMHPNNSGGCLSFSRTITQNKMPTTKDLMKGKLYSLEPAKSISGS